MRWGWSRMWRFWGLGRVFFRDWTLKRELFSRWGLELIRMWEIWRREFGTSWGEIFFKIMQEEEEWSCASSGEAYNIPTLWNTQQCWSGLGWDSRIRLSSFIWIKHWRLAPSILLSIEESYANLDIQGTSIQPKRAWKTNIIQTIIAKAVKHSNKLYQPPSRRKIKTEKTKNHTGFLRKLSQGCNTSLMSKP